MGYAQHDVGRAMMRRTRMAENESCPYLVQVMADHLALYPVSLYCTSGERTRVPGAMKIAEVCEEPAHTQCSGYVAARRAPASSCIEESLGLEGGQP
jgi:hypothetical protein